MWKLGEKSKKAFNTLDENLQTLIKAAQEYSPIDFSIVYGYRSPEEQFELFKIGRELQPDGTWKKVGGIVTNCDGFKIKSNHNYLPSRAFDFKAYIKNKPHLAYKEYNLMALASMFLTLGKLLFESGAMSYKIRSGSNWDMDGEFLTDQTFNDIDHIELVRN